MADSRLRVIVGPTAAGKSALAVALCEANDGAVISADSRQVYRGFDIGTAKPTPAERALVPHFGLDVAEPGDRWSAARFAGHASGWIAEARAGGRTPVVVGGTGFWVAALVAPLAPMPDLDPQRRAELAAYLDRLPGGSLRAWCEELDPAIASLGPAQWRRAIEMALLAGVRLSDLHAAAPAIAPRDVRYLVVDPGDALEDRIAGRVRAMFAAGWVDEVGNLMRSVPGDAAAWKACGYDQLRAALVAGVPVADVLPAIILDTRQYARRQRTWFRRQLKHGPVTRLDPGAGDATARAQAWWNGEDHE